jgi:radical SAM protein with 4Fe4S-binding SPASM domain
MIDYAKAKNILVNIDSNFSMELSDYKLSRIINSGLSTLQISLDGATATSYNKYRQNGDFDLVYNNLKRLRDFQKEQGATSPKIIWKFIVNKYNQHELEQAKKMAQEIDVEILFDKIGLADDIVDLQVTPQTSLLEKKATWLPSDPNFIRDKYLADHVSDQICPMLFKNIFVHSNGQILPCCYVADEASAMGDLNKQPLSDIWNSNKYLYARSLFFPQAKVKKESVVCEHCQLFAGHINNNI